MHFLTKSIKKQINFDIRKLHILLLNMAVTLFFFKSINIFLGAIYLFMTLKAPRCSLSLC